MPGSYFGPHRKSNRWAKWNYSDFGFYFVTVCAKDRIEYFGRVENGMMMLNEYGEIVKKCWENIENHFDNVGIDEFVVMPNHLHGIILLMDDETTATATLGDTSAIAAVGNRHACSLQYGQYEQHRQYQKLPTILGSYKSSVSRKINESQHEFQFKWQKSFYDHIIRNEISLAKIRQYIINNPVNWFEDRNNMPNLYY